MSSQSIHSTDDRQARMQNARERGPSLGRADWPPHAGAPLPSTPGHLPEIHASELHGTALARAFAHHGALLVRGLIPRSEANELARGIDHALHDMQAWRAGTLQASTSWYDRVALVNEDIADARDWVEGAGGVWAADSPDMFASVVATLDRSGVIQAATGYLGERPLLSVGKTTLRRVPASMEHTDWHQDGAFLGREVRSVNLWLALSPCGVDASALDIVPRRLDLQPTGSHGAIFPWAVGHMLAEEMAGPAGIYSPTFEPGDALLFDHLLLHRTSLPPGRTKDRWAIECWMFAPSAYPAEQVALAI
jgi:hypothetical protein